MSKTFEKLSQTHVRLDLPDGGSVNVPMLPVSAIPKLDGIGKRMAAAKDLDGVAAVRGEMIELALTVLPPELQAGVQRLRVDKLAELLAYLMYGDDDDQPVPGAKKNGGTETATETGGAPTSPSSPSA